MNVLDRQIHKGEKLVLTTGETVEAIGGFGLSPHTMGIAIVVRYANGDTGRAEDVIDIEATRALPSDSDIIAQHRDIPSEDEVANRHPMPMGRRIESMMREHEQCSSCGSLVGHGCPESEPCDCDKEEDTP